MQRWSLLALLSATVGCAPAAPAPTPAPETAPPAPQASLSARPERPIPYPVVPSQDFRQAVANGTRSADGRPGPRYWQNWAEYRIRARVLPQERRLEGSQTVRYHNRSPDTLQVLVLDLAQNLHAQGAVRLEPAEVTGGVRLSRVAVRGQTLGTGAGDGGPRYLVDGTKLVIVPGAPVLPGESVDLALDWSFIIPQAGAGERMGYDRDNLLFLAYWYPQMAVYDDVVGWHPDQFLGPSEFYSGFASYDLSIEAPAGWLVMATGRLTNPEAVLSEPVLARLRAAERSDTVVRVVTTADLARATRSRPGGTLTWTFRADSVRDVAFSMTRESLWDAVRTPVGDRDGDGTQDYARVDAIYRSYARHWPQTARYAQHAIRFLSRYTGYPYPWPHMSVVEGGGIIGGGMEYPMMTLIGHYNARGDSALYNVTAHELAHMWVPMIVGVDERRYSWMDEGTTTYHENEARSDFHPGPDHHLADRESYLEVALTGEEGEIMRRSSFHYPGPAFGVASYSKPATVLVALRGLLGRDTFERGLREFIRRWAYKHPYPWDMWNTFEDVSGRELDWFWRAWYHETWLLDHAVRSVTESGRGWEIVVEDRGQVPMPVRLTITRAGGERLHREIPVEVWLAGARIATVTVPPGNRVERVEIDAENVFPDADRSNNAWPR